MANKNKTRNSGNAAGRMKNEMSHVNENKDDIRCYDGHLTFLSASIDLYSLYIKAN